MSYDLTFLRLKAGQDVDAALEELEDEEDDSEIIDRTSSAFDAAQQGEKQRLADALIARDPRLIPFIVDHSAGESTQGSEANLKQLVPDIELNDEGSNSGIQILLSDAAAYLSIAYWHKDEEARRVWHQIWSYIDVLQKEGEFTTYDPQLGRVLDISSDFEPVVAGYTGTKIAVDKYLGSKVNKKPWWQFWGK